MNVYDFTVKAQDGSDVSLADYKGKVLLIVNTATGCGFTPQYTELQELYKEHKDDGLEILDRVGGGDSFASGLIYGLMTTGDPELAVNYGAAHGALAMTTPGDTSMAVKEEVEAIMKNGSARVKR